MRRIVAYDANRRAIWEDLGPSETWLAAKPGRAIGGQAIEPIDLKGPAPALPRIRPKP